MSFTLLKTDRATKARLGRLATAHGIIDTPAFMPVGTKGTVKAMTPEELREAGAQIILGNTYHLALRPGMHIIKKCGGLHSFMNWHGPILTDSGGYQVFSLAKLRKVSDDGVEFQSHLDGTQLFLGPRETMKIQRVLGSDIAMTLDECPSYPCDRDSACQAVKRTLLWARVCRSEKRLPGQLVFGIVQGAKFMDLRCECAEALVNLEFDGYALGGLSLGEPEVETMEMVEATVPFLPGEKPRYAMGMGTPAQMIELVARGIDLFDCALPTRIARNGTAFTRRGTFQIKAGAYKAERGPIEKGCRCYACQHYDRAYVRHLFNAEEILGLRLLTMHNLYCYLQLMHDIRSAIATGKFGALYKKITTGYQKARGRQPRVSFASPGENT